MATILQSDSYVGYMDSAKSYEVTLSWSVEGSSTSTSRYVNYTVTLKNARSDGSIIADPTSAFTAAVNGTTVKTKTWTTKTTISAGETKTPLSGSHSVSCNADGTFDTIKLCLTAKIGSSDAKTVTKTWSITPTKTDVRATFYLVDSFGYCTLGKKDSLSIYDLRRDHYVDVVASCGSYSQTIASKAATTSTYGSYYYTFPVSWAATNTTGTKVTVTFTLKTYYKSGSSYIQIGDAVTKTATHAIPTSIVPSCTVAVVETTTDSDGTTYYERFGGLIPGYSKVKASITSVTTAYGSEIQQYSLTRNRYVLVDGSEKTYTLTYKEKEHTFPIATSVNGVYFGGSVTDARGRTGYSTELAGFDNVLSYTKPSASIEVRRSDADGTENISGEYCTVTYGGTVQSYGVTNDNDKSFTLEYGTTDNFEYRHYSVTLPMSDYTVSDLTYTFSASQTEAYKIVLTIKDTFTSVSYTKQLSTAFAILHFPKDGEGMSVGMLSKNGGFEVGMSAYFYGGLSYDVQLLTAPDLDGLTTSGRYFADKATNGPNTNVSTGFVEVCSINVGEFIYAYQKFVFCQPSSSPPVAVRLRCSRDGGDTWSDWTTAQIGST